MMQLGSSMLWVLLFFSRVRVVILCDESITCDDDGSVWLGMRVEHTLRHAFSLLLRSLGTTLFQRSL